MKAAMGLKNMNPNYKRVLSQSISSFKEQFLELHASIYRFTTNQGKFCLACWTVGKKGERIQYENLLK